MYMNLVSVDINWIVLFLNFLKLYLTDYASCLIVVSRYSRVPNSGTGTNNSTGCGKSKKLIIVQGGINVIGGIYPKIK